MAWWTCILFCDWLTDLSSTLFFSFFFWIDRLICTCVCVCEQYLVCLSSLVFFVLNVICNSNEVIGEVFLSNGYYMSNLVLLCYWLLDERYGVKPAQRWRETRSSSRCMSWHWNWAITSTMEPRGGTRQLSNLSLWKNCPPRNATLPISRTCCSCWFTNAFWPARRF